MKSDRFPLRWPRSGAASRWAAASCGGLRPMVAHRRWAMVAVFGAAIVTLTHASLGPAQATTHKPRKPKPVTTTVAPLTTDSAANVTDLPMLIGRTPVEWARDMVANITEAQTDYDHGLGPVTWSAVDGSLAYESRTDCSGYILALYQKAYQVTPTQLGTWLGKKRPHATNFADAIKTGHGYALLTNIADVAPGDLIAVRYPNPGKGDNTGHLMLVETAPVPHGSSKPIIDGTQQFDVRIIDQSSTGHGPTDTRHHADKTFADGVGSGTIRLYTDMSGATVGYAWSDISVSPYYSQAERPMSIGRLDPLHAW